MKGTASRPGQDRQGRARLRMIQHDAQVSGRVSGNVCQNRIPPELETLILQIREVQFLKGQSGHFYRFTAIDEATRYRILKLYAHNSVKSATDFVEELRRRLLVAVPRVQTDPGAAVGTDFSWNLHDLGIAPRNIPRRGPASNGKVERSHGIQLPEVSAQ